MDPCPLAIDLVHHAPAASMRGIGKLIAMADVVRSDVCMERRIGRDTSRFGEWPPTLLAPSLKVFFRNVKVGASPLIPRIKIDMRRLVGNSHKRPGPAKPLVGLLRRNIRCIVLVSNEAEEAAAEAKQRYAGHQYRQRKPEPELAR